VDTLVEEYLVVDTLVEEYLNFVEEDFVDILVEDSLELGHIVACSDLQLVDIGNFADCQLYQF